MAGGQPALIGAGETIAEFMRRRSREAASRAMAEQVGRAAWAASAGTGKDRSAPRTADVVALGVRTMDRRRAAAPRTMMATAQPATTFRPAAPPNQISGARVTPQKPQK